MIAAWNNFPGVLDAVWVGAAIGSTLSAVRLHREDRWEWMPASFVALNLMAFYVLRLAFNL